MNAFIEALKYGNDLSRTDELTTSSLVVGVQFDERCSRQPDSLEGVIRIYY